MVPEYCIVYSTATAANLDASANTDQNSPPPPQRTLVLFLLWPKSLQSCDVINTNCTHTQSCLSTQYTIMSCHDTTLVECGFNSWWCATLATSWSSLLLRLLVPSTSSTITYWLTSLAMHPLKCTIWCLVYFQAVHWWMGRHPSFALQKFNGCCQNVGFNYKSKRVYCLIGLPEVSPHTLRRLMRLHNCRSVPSWQLDPALYSRVKIVCVKPGEKCVMQHHNYICMYMNQSISQSIINLTCPQTRGCHYNRRQKNRVRLANYC